MAWIAALGSVGDAIDLARSLTLYARRGALRKNGARRGLPTNERRLIPPMSHNARTCHTSCLPVATGLS